MKRNTQTDVKELGWEWRGMTMLKIGKIRGLLLTLE